MAQQKSFDELAEEVAQNGGFAAIFYFDLHAPSEEEVKNLMVGFISKLTGEPGVLYAVGEIDKPIQKENLFSTWAEVKILANDFSTLVRLSTMYSPIGVEIIQPSEVRLSLSEAQGILLDISQTSLNFTKLIMERVLSKEEVEQYKSKLQQRAELGKRLLQKKQ
ncbi:MAG: hypothetical protein N3G80_00345 [Candidatus Micrarchaeota archaeon]|nr:hypothetical protein [Candidatus Micrarchaeota archaeon]